MMFDKVEIISKSLVQHGPNNDRIYLMKIHPEERIENLIDQLYNLAILKRYTKIFVKVPESVCHMFLDHNFKLEATVFNLYNGVEQGCFLGKYFNAKRGFLTKKEKNLINEVKDSALATNDISEFEAPADCEIIKLSEEDIPVIARIYKQVFQFYPFPIFKEKYLLDTLRSNVQYYGVRSKGEVIAVSAAEMDTASSNVEMTDFATLPQYRGRNLSYYLLQKMMSCMRNEGIQTAYTIARSTSFGMNKTFARQGFQFGGTLVNNTLIGDTIEPMNVWFRSL
ncbi:MAG: putative beta-lysine N-acetyltransferase [Cytophagales bacterium]|nr:putative beta-lysine N-acetyltransferase [Cytophagales bacterium]